MVLSRVAADAFPKACMCSWVRAAVSDEKEDMAWMRALFDEVAGRVANSESVVLPVSWPHCVSYSILPWRDVVLALARVERH